MAKAVKGQRSAVAGILDLRAMLEKEKLQAVDGPICHHIVRNQQLMPARRLRKLLPERDGNGLVDGNRADLSAFPLDRDGLFPKRLFRRRRVDPEAFMNAQSGITGKVHGKDVIIVLIFQRKAKHPVKLGNAPGPVLMAEDPALEFDTEFAVVRKPIFRVRHLVMEKANGR